MKRYLSILILLMLVLVSSAQEWEVPQDRDERLSGFEFTEATVEIGLSLYNLNCKSCHGDPGKANFQKLNPLPGDPATDKVQHNSDGALQFKISEGRGLMPSFKKILAADDVWNVISYLRSFNNNYNQEVALLQKLTNVKWSEIKIDFNPDPDKHILKVEISGLEGERWTPVPFTEVRLSAKRYFGFLTLDTPKSTDASGIAEFSLPHLLPGDKEGNINLRAQLTDTDLFGEIESDFIFKNGVTSDLPSLTEERAMWNTNLMAPIWLLLVYPGVVLSVWALIFFVLFQLRKIHRLGKDE